MTLEQLAKKAGVTLGECGPEWGGGRISYKTEDAPYCSVCGFKTPAAAYRHWLKNTLGEKAARAVLGLLEKEQS